MKFTTLLPKNLIGTRWEEFIDAIDEYLQKFKTEKMLPLANKFVPEESDKTNLRDLVSRKGFKLIEADGYASSIEYFKRRAKTLPTEILWALSTKCYEYVLKSFWFNGKTYSLEIDLDGFYYPKTDIKDQNSLTTDIQYLDQEVDIINYYLNGLPVPNPPIKTFLPALFLDTDEFHHLDRDDQRKNSNHFLIDFGFNVVEDKDLFISENTAKALYETVGQIHRLKETPHYRTLLPFTFNTDGSVRKRKYTTYDFDSTKESYMETVYIQSNFSLVAYVELGSNPYPTLSNNISRVNVPVGIIPISGTFEIVDYSVSGLVAEYLIKEYGNLSITGGTEVFSFSELALLDEDFKTIAYAKFPEINYYEPMYTSMKLIVDCVDITN